MTPQTQLEQKARELLAQCNGSGYFVGEQHLGLEKLTTLIQKADTINKIRSIIGCADANPSIICLAASKIKAKADALDWLDKHYYQFEQFVKNKYGILPYGQLLFAIQLEQKEQG